MKPASALKWTRNHYSWIEALLEFDSYFNRIEPTLKRVAGQGHEELLHDLEIICSDSFLQQEFELAERHYEQCAARQDIKPIELKKLSKRRDEIRAKLNEYYASKLKDYRPRTTH